MFPQLCIPVDECFKVIVRIRVRGLELKVVKKKKRKISNILIGFCSLYLSCSILEKYNFITNLYIILSC